tara:strand:- start:695 stop:1168 length:474 start_codon:yes stop_codon:yes gene_type:complete
MEIKDQATKDKEAAAGGLGILVILFLIVLPIYISFRCSKIVYSYSRSALLAVWTFLVLLFLVVISIRFFNQVEFLESKYAYEATAQILAGFWVAGVGSIVFSTHTIYNKRKSEVDKLIKEESNIEQEISKGRSSSVRLLTGAGALYLGYKLGKKTGM